MTGAPITRDRPALLRRSLRLEYLTVGWNVLEGIVSIGAGIVAGSVALIGFCVDSAVECVSSSLLIWRLRGETLGADDERVEILERRGFEARRNRPFRARMPHVVHVVAVIERPLLAIFCIPRGSMGPGRAPYDLRLARFHGPSSPAASLRACLQSSAQGVST